MKIACIDQLTCPEDRFILTTILKIIVSLTCETNCEVVSLNIFNIGVEFA